MSGQARLSVRIDLPNGGRFGPGKAALLRAIASEGSIRKAAAALSMSYPRALKLIDEMNGDFSTPLISSSHGGATGGGSSLTAMGEQVLALYAEITDAASTASTKAVGTLCRLQD
ncbi:MAG: LysR family transcriptional regulator [Henriciella sp.]|jgi:molybdate transport system regulatory protein|uniref:winged helix-turn-helix domain-containing protein n=1 Tax=Henriciella sp. TaxID=1968823 RepID=UPI000C0FC98E|nr:LysR family transcriptional regulator [Henriciella sp.]MAN72506.1 LysR family transcriptional regulator [Henriciella sp.]MBF32936.1 LysR family transcriptional regulator [Hyphomonadaceae bacterium]MBK74758.1 LysR family transcriptional regulator [Henriciella sp.]PHR74796.1 MAG: LysR family transcriptional regulator [Henriciella sp.]|tara:strand:- start:1339 stop:1683 length:345 start_codon:yes stop_codon:yes gene_type:complete